MRCINLDTNYASRLGVESISYR